MGRARMSRERRATRIVLATSENICHIFNKCMICIEDPPQQFDALLVRLHQQSMLIFATLALSYPKSALEPFQLRKFSLVRSFEWLFLAGILKLSLTILKPYIFCQHHNDWSREFREPNLYSALSTSRPFWEYLLETSGFLERQQLLAEAYSRKFKLKFVRILITHPVYKYFRNS